MISLIFLGFEFEKLYKSTTQYIQNPLFFNVLISCKIDRTDGFFYSDTDRISTSIYPNPILVFAE